MNKAYLDLAEAARAFMKQQSKLDLVRTTSTRKKIEIEEEKMLNCAFGLEACLKNVAKLKKSK